MSSGRDAKEGGSGVCDHACDCAASEKLRSPKLLMHGPLLSIDRAGHVNFSLATNRISFRELEVVMRITAEERTDGPEEGRLQC